MPILFLLSLFAGGLVFHSEELSAETAQSSQGTEVMNFLVSVFQPDAEIVTKHDTALETFFSDIKDCTYNDGIVHTFQSLIGYSACDEIVDSALENQLSYFLLKKGLENSSLEEERKQAVKDSLQAVKADKCQEAEPLFSNPPPSLVEDSFWSVFNQGYDDYSRADSINYITHLCKEKAIESEEDELIAFLSSELKSCPLEGPESFSCEALIEETRNLGLSYYQVRYAIQKTQKEREEEQIKPAVAVDEGADRAEKQQVKKP
ncbi:MAG: hypothetical protein OXN83_03085 [Oligoflexia bacterium]|nr:hypothetical protein [Oligoflexia bacterium]